MATCDPTLLAAVTGKESRFRHPAKPAGRRVGISSPTRREIFLESTMNNHEVFLLSNSDEVFLGTVGEILDTGAYGGYAYMEARGMSLLAAFSDLISEIAFNNGSQTFTIELREPEAL